MKRSYVLLIILVSSVSTFAQVDTISNISDQEKIWGLTKFYAEAKYNFVYFDKSNINWDSAYQAFLPQVLSSKSTWDYYIVLSRFSALLKDGHTGITVPMKLFRSSRYKHTIIENFNGKLYITNVSKDQGTEDLLGAEVVRINHEPSSSWVQKNIIPTISASTEHQLWNDAAYALFYSADSTQTWQLQLKTIKGTIVNYQTGWHTYRANWLRPFPRLERFSFKKMGNTGYLQVNTFGDEGVIEDFKKVLPALYDCKSIIIDLRMNQGGNSRIAAEFLKYFTSRPKIIGSAWKTRDNQAAYKAWGENLLADHRDIKMDSLTIFEKKSVQMARNDFWYQGDTMTFINDITVKKLDQPLIVLQGNRTASAAEDFLIMLHSLNGRARTVGQKSYGSTGQPLFFDMPGGGSARICAKRDTYPDGKEFVGYGIQPDIETERNVIDIINDIDTELRVALKELN